MYKMCTTGWMLTSWASTDRSRTYRRVVWPRREKEGEKGGKKENKRACREGSFHSEQPLETRCDYNSTLLQIITAS